MSGSTGSIGTFTTSEAYSGFMFDCYSPILTDLLFHRPNVDLPPRTSKLQTVVYVLFLHVSRSYAF